MPAKKPTTKKPVAKKTTAKKTSTHHDTKVEGLEKKMGELDKKFGFVNKLLKQKRMKDLLGAKAVNDVNKALKPALTTIFIVIAVLAFISALASFFGVFGMIGLGAFGISGGFIFMMIILLLLATILSLLTGIGLIKKKTRLPSVLFLNFGLQIILLIVSSMSRGVSSGSQWLSFVVMLALLLVVLKNKSYFNK